MEQYLDQYMKYSNYGTVIYPNIKDYDQQYPQLQDHHEIGYYCKLQRIDKQELGLTYIHKVKYNNLKSLPIETEEDQIIQQLQENLNLKEMDQKISLQEKNNKFIEQKELKPEIIFYSEHEEKKLINFKDLELVDRVKIDSLIQYTKLVNSSLLNKQKSFFFNYHDIEEFLDDLGFLSWQTGIFSKEEIIKLQLGSNFSERIDLAQEILKKLHSLSNKMKDIGKMAERNIQMKKSKEFNNEIINIVKNIAQQNEITKLDKIQIEFNEKKAPENIIKIFDENMSRIRELDSNNPEYNSLLNYLKWVACLPFGIFSEQEFDLLKAKAIMEEDHQGLKDVKQRILEFLAVGKLKNSIKGKIICLQGPPGVGKTSFAYSIAKVLNRKSYRISLGGENDVSVLKGHRKTYIGSRPGKIIEALKQTKYENCVIIIDEIDKTASQTTFGDPQSTLLEILDPEQNNQFVDNFLDFPVDLSKVFFICTANQLNTISQPLLDRMDIIEINSYTNLEKKQIFQNHILPEAIKNTGLAEYVNLFQIQDNVIDIIINYYSRDSGIRSLQKNTNKMLEKIAFQILQKTEKIENSEKKEKIEKIIVDEKNYTDFLGQKQFEDNEIYEELMPGVIKGLAYSGFGGSVLFIEATKAGYTEIKSGMKITGSLGDVMKESMQISYSFSRKFLKEMKNDFLEKNQIHIHVPEGATPKDGPSAGISITSSIISLARDQKINNDIAMTGEISLKGKIMKIGGLKEKVIAAKREGVKKVILPFENKENAEDLPEDVSLGIEFKFVKNYKEVFEILFNQFNNEQYQKELEEISDEKNEL